MVILQDFNHKSIFVFVIGFQINKLTNKLPRNETFSCYF